MPRHKRADGVVARHKKACATRGGGRRCTCAPSYEAWVWDEAAGRKIRRSFPTDREAREWRSDALRALDRGALRAAEPVTVREFGEDYVKAALAGARIARKGKGGEAVAYKPSSARTVEEALRLRVFPAVGARKMSDVTRADVCRLVDRWDAEGMSASTIRNTVHALRALYRRAMEHGVVHEDPTARVPLPRQPQGRDRVATPGEAAALLAALEDAQDRALWGCAVYAGLRRGELLALRWEDVDLAEGVIRVTRSLDVGTGSFVAPKSRAGTRTVPIVKPLRTLLAAHRLARVDTSASTLVFAGPEGRPLHPTTVRKRALRAWQAADLEPIGLHECRHTFASLVIAAGANVKALSVLMGHASVGITLDRYGHLLPGAEREAARLLDGLLESVGR